MVSDTHMENIWDSAYSPVGQATSPLRPDTQHQRRYEDAKGFCRPASFIRTRFGCACFASPPEGKRIYFCFCLPGPAMSITGATSGRPVSFVTPFRQAAFAVIWTATLVSNVGGWMYSAASGWLMTSLNPDPFIVALVQAADTLPICLFAFPAGVMADIFDKRKFLIVVETLTTVISADLCGDRGPWRGYPRKPVAVHVPCWRRRSFDCTGMAVCGAATGS